MRAELRVSLGAARAELPALLTRPLGFSRPRAGGRARAAMAVDSYAHVLNDETPHGTVGCSERARILANRITYSRSYTALYFGVLMLSLLLLLWVVVEADYPLGHAVKFWVFVLLDGAVTLFIVAEVTISLLAVGCRRFCSSACNVIDAAVVALWEWLVRRIEWLSASHGEGRDRGWHEAFRVGAVVTITERLRAGQQDTTAQLETAALVRVREGLARRQQRVQPGVRGCGWKGGR